MKKIFNNLLTLVIVLLLVSCSSTDEKMRVMIPDDAVGVVRINLSSLLKKADIIKGEGKDAELTIPSDLKTVIDQANENIQDDVNIIGDVINNLSESGIDVSSDCYIFMSNGTFKAVALLPLNDEDKAQELVRKIAGAKMSETSGVLYSSKLDYAFAIDDDVLLIGHKNNVADDKASAAVKQIFGKAKPSIFEKEDISKAIDVEDSDITAYIDAKGLPLFFESTQLKTDMGGFSPVDVLDGSGIKAMTVFINFNNSNKGDEKVDVVTDFICDNNSIYSILYDKVVATAAHADGVSALNEVPGDFDTYFAFKVNGEELVKMPGIAKLLQSIPIKGINYSDIVSSLNGAVVCGLQEDGLNEYNFGVSAQSMSSKFIVDEIVNYANLHGQAPSFNANGEYHYDTTDGNRALVLNNVDDVVYLRCVNYVPSSTATEWPALVNTLKTSTVALFRLVMLGTKHEGSLCWGLKSKTHGEGFYYTEDPDDNIVISTLKCLCWVEQSSSYEDDDEEIDLLDY